MLDHWEQNEEMSEVDESKIGAWTAATEPTTEMKAEKQKEMFLSGLRYRGWHGFERSGIVECTWCGHVPNVGYLDNKFWCPKINRKGVVKCP